MSRFTPVRLIRNEFELDDLIRSSGTDRRLVEQDFALMTITCALATAYRDSLCFKGGMVPLNVPCCRPVAWAGRRTAPG